MRCAILFFLLAVCVAAQSSEEEFRVYSEHPRLLLNRQRLRLLKRERERESMRWRQFETLIQGGAQFPEPGFALALYSIVTGDATATKRAIDWALGPTTDIRQMALVYDWRHDLLTPAQAEALRAKIQKAAAQGLPANDFAARRDRVFAAIATADDSRHNEEPILRETVSQWWRGVFCPGLAAGRASVSLIDAYPLIELLHVIRENLNVDLRESAAEYFRVLPAYLVIGNYPAPYQAPENEFRIPAYRHAGQPDLDQAALARAAGLSMVAFDTNAIENQFLQGWLMQDQYVMRGVFGAPYEFLWANPYQPGLSFYNMPLLFHDKETGALFIRSSWEDNAAWFGLPEGEAQLFRDGRITVLNQKSGATALSAAIQIGPASIIAGRDAARFTIDSEATFVVGLKPLQRYLVEVDDEEMDEFQTDPAGTLVLESPDGRRVGVRIKEALHGRTGT